MIKTIAPLITLILLSSVCPAQNTQRMNSEKLIDLLTRDQNIESLGKAINAETLYDLLFRDQIIGKAIDDYKNGLLLAIDQQGLSNTEALKRKEEFSKRFDGVGLKLQCRRKIVRMYMERFSKDELTGVVDFFTGPIGRKFLTENGVVRKQTLEMLDQEFTKIAEELTPYLVYGEEVDHELTADVGVKNLSDEQLEMRLLGTWVEPGENSSSSAETTFYKNKKYHLHGTIVWGGKEHKIFFVGTWKVTDGILVYKTTDSHDPDYLSSRDSPFSRDRIIEISDTRFKYQSLKHGRVKTLTRKRGSSKDVW